MKQSRVTMFRFHRRNELTTAIKLKLTCLQPDQLANASFYSDCFTKYINKTSLSKVKFEKII